MNEALDVEAWIELAKSNPVEYRRRQAAHVLLESIARIPELRSILYLKGGALMNLAYGSPRRTTDIDFTTTDPPKGFQHYIKAELDTAMRTAAADLGYAGLVLQVQSHEFRPSDEEASWPTLKLRIGLAEFGTRQAERLDLGMAANVLQVDISFNEEVVEIEPLSLDQSGNSILSYSFHEIVGEKLRAILQQPSRERVRGQDVYDISRLLETRKLDAADKARILDILKVKAKSRNLEITRDSIFDEQVEEMARIRYENLALEVDEETIDFEKDLQAVRELYASLPWPL